MIDEQPTITLAQPDPPSMVTTRPPEDAPPMQQPPSMVTTRAPDAPPLEAAAPPPVQDLEAQLVALGAALALEPGQPAAAMDWAKQHVADALGWVQEHRRRVAAGEEAYPYPDAPETWPGQQEPAAPAAPEAATVLQEPEAPPAEEPAQAAAPDPAPEPQADAKAPPAPARAKKN